MPEIGGHFTLDESLRSPLFSRIGEVTQLADRVPAQADRVLELSGSGEHRRWLPCWRRPARRFVRLRRSRWAGRGRPADGTSAALRCGEGPAGARTPVEIGRSNEVPNFIYEAAGHRWWLWWPCEACGGTKLPLRDRADVDGSNRVRGGHLAGSGDQPCPGCETRRRRLELAGGDPAVWYDAWLGDWVVRVSYGDVCESALLPLEIQWFDASWAEVYRAASDIVYADDAFETAARAMVREVRRDGGVDGAS